MACKHPPQVDSLDCPKCYQAIFIEQDSRPDGSIICDNCKAKFTDYDTLLHRAAIERRRRKLEKEELKNSVINELDLKLAHFEAWLTSAEAASASKKKFINRGMKVADLCHGLRILNLPPDQAEQLQARIEALEQQYIAAGRQVGEPTSTPE